MNIVCNREKLLSSFQTAATIAPSRSPKAILQCVKFTAHAEQSVLMATDMELGIRIRVEDVEVLTPGSAVLPVARFGALLRESSDEKLRLEADGQGILVRGDRSEFNFSAQNPDEFPDIADFREEKFHAVAARLLKELIRRTLFATDNESSRFALGGILLEFEPERIIAVGTDGRRLAKMEGPALAQGGHHHESATIVPSKSMQLIDRAISDADGEIKLSARGNDVLLRSGRATIYSRLVDGRFPKWREVLPAKPQGSQIDLTVGPMFSALRQASIVASDESRGITFTFEEGRLSLAGKTAEVGQSRVELPIAYEGETVSLLLDHRYLSDFLKVLDPDKTFSFHIRDADSAALCTTDDGYSYVLMPLAQSRAAKSA